MKKISIIVISLFLFNCSSKFFDEQLLVEHDSIEKLNIYSFDFYKSRLDIKQDFIEVAVISTDMHFYGNFFYDQVFMGRLREKVYSLNANAIVYEKDKKDFENYNENFIYFTVIRLIEK